MSLGDTFDLIAVEQPAERVVAGIRARDEDSAPVATLREQRSESRSQPCNYFRPKWQWRCAPR
jgi:hypothetical protein